MVNWRVRSAVLVVVATLVVATLGVMGCGDSSSGGGSSHAVDVGSSDAGDLDAGSSDAGGLDAAGGNAGRADTGADTSADDAGRDAAPPMALAEFVATFQQEYVDALCSAVYDCPQKQPPLVVQFGSPFGDKATCMDHVVQVFHLRNEPTMGPAVAHGWADFNADKAAACLDALQQLGCAAQSDITRLLNSAPCSEVYTPKQALGDDCNRDDVCISHNCHRDSAYCTGVCLAAQGTAGSGESCDSTPCESTLVCVPLADGTTRDCLDLHSRQEGDTCAPNGSCADGLVCGLANKCIRPPNYVGEGSTCNLSDTFCNPGLICDGVHSTGTGVEGTCAPPHAEGEPCPSALACQYNLLCKVPTGGTAGVCTPHAVIHDPCSRDADCQDGLVCHGGVCSNPPVCL